ncbi:hypothetical protein BTN49_2403 [Candidatus Enterovibrio escicola]|uniref:Uncharacterized protein n=1 Tax=Candidatus Enterovibrio escicola TaxID=1927127 RepID=A0A2A5T1D8_9GAMM|nr:hypothetical protein BTN49_2403 [Candidatus Enterovibrio escacola]
MCTYFEFSKEEKHDIVHADSLVEHPYIILKKGGISSLIGK